MPASTDALDIEKTQNLVNQAYIKSDVPWVVAYSGGKDSSVVLDLFIKAAQKHPDGPHIYVVSNNTRVESPLVSMLQHKAHKSGSVFQLTQDMSLEHILPQEWGPKLAGWTHFDVEQHASMHRRLGNIMLLTKVENEKANRKPFPEKMLIYGNSLYRDAYLISDYEGWDEKAIRDRQERIARHLCKVWQV